MFFLPLASPTVLPLLAPSTSPPPLLFCAPTCRRSPLPVTGRPSLLFLSSPSPEHPLPQPRLLLFLPSLLFLSLTSRPPPTSSPLPSHLHVLVPSSPSPHVRTPLVDSSALAGTPSPNLFSSSSAPSLSLVTPSSSVPLPVAGRPSMSSATPPCHLPSASLISFSAPPRCPLLPPSPSPLPTLLAFPCHRPYPPRAIHRHCHPPPSSFPPVASFSSPSSPSPSVVLFFPRCLHPCQRRQPSPATTLTPTSGAPSLPFSSFFFSSCRLVLFSPSTFPFRHPLLLSPPSPLPKPPLFPCHRSHSLRAVPHHCCPPPSSSPPVASFSSPPHLPLLSSFSPLAAFTPASSSSPLPHLPPSPSLISSLPHLSVAGSPFLSLTSCQAPPFPT